MIWNFEQYKKNTALLDEYGKSVTYETILKIGHEIKAAIKDRCLVFSMCENSIGSVVGYAGFVNNGIVPVLLSIHLDKELLDNLILTYNPRYIWLPESKIEDFTDYISNEVLHICGYSLLKTIYDDNYEINDKLCLLLTTSGSTGSPKFVRQSYVNVRSNANSIVEYLKLNSTERPITTLPMNYTYGLSIINSHFMVGATILLTDKGLMQKEFWQFFKSAGATSFGGVPYTYEMLDRLRFYRMELPSLRYMTQAGGKLHLDLHRKFAEYANEKGLEFIVMYGQCEATARMGYLPPDKAIEKCGSMGIPIPGGSFSLINDEESNIEGCDIAGELIYEGDNVTMGYAECRNDLAKADELNGILHTGDMAKRDADGFYYIVGRKKRFLKIYGNRVNLDEIDQLLKGEFAGCEICSAGVDDHMYIFVTDGTIADEVKDFLVKKTRLNPVAFRVIEIDEIPKNDSGKILYKELTQYY